MLSEIIYKRTYSREGEEWIDTIERVCKGLKVLGWYGDDLPELKDFMLKRKGLVSGRSLWQLGAPGFIGDSLQSCWCVNVNSLGSFLFTFNELMLGGGVGFNIQTSNVYELKKVKFDVNVKLVDDNDCSFIVPDNREGWIELVKKIFDAFFINGKDFSYSVNQIRVAGEKIKSFGGVASGPEALVEGVKSITKILKRRYDKKLRPIDCLDVMNIIGKVVVSGNVRRSSEIAIGDCHDELFVNAKKWPYPNFRNMSNNSVACNDLKMFRDWDTFETDPIGFVNLKNMRRYGRLTDGVDYRPDYKIIGCNPCGEIGLEDREPCNLAEIYLPNIHGIEEFKRVSYLLLKACKLITMVEFHDSVTQRVVERNRRVGIGIAGIAQVKINYTQLDTIYRWLEFNDHIISEKLGIPTSIKLTTVKPGGTMCLMAGVTPGMSEFSEYVIRRVRFSSNDIILDKLSWAGYNMEPQLNMDGSIDSRVVVVSFPLRYKGVHKSKGVIELLNTQKNLQTYWADNCISCTHTYQKDELGKIKEWMNKYYKECVKTTCFSPKIVGFKQMPIEGITKEKYLEMEVKDFEITPGDEVIIDCEGASCPVK